MPPMNDPNPSPGSKSSLAWAAAIAAVAIALRLIFLFGAGDRTWPHSTYFEGDAPLFAEWAAALDRGESFEQGLPLHSPVVPYLMHWLAPVGGPTAGPPPARDFVRLKVVWCVVSGLTCGLFYLATARSAGRRAALIASLLCAAYFGAYLSATSLTGETLYAALIVAAIGLTQRFRHSPSWTVAIALGVIHGAATLLRAEHPLLALLLCFTMLRRPVVEDIVRQIQPRVGEPDDENAPPALAPPAPPAPPRRALPTLAMLAVMVALCTPWTLSSHAAIQRLNSVESTPIDYSGVGIEWTPDAREFIASLPAFARRDNVIYMSAAFRTAGRTQVTAADARTMLERQFEYVPQPMSEWVFVSSQGPLAFALANHPRADGGFSKAALDARFGANPALQLSLPSHLRLYNRGFAAGWEWIRSDPKAWADLAVKKLERFDAGAALGFGATNAPLGRSGVRQPADLATQQWSASAPWRWTWFAILAVGAICSLLRGVCRLWLIVIVFKLLVTLAFFGYARQAVSIAPAFCVLAALAIDELLRRLPASKVAQVAGYMVVAGLTALLFVTDSRTAFRPAEMSVRGPAQMAPRWGPGAFESAQRIELIFDPPAATTAPTRS
jgi:hypothetical protein